MSDGGTSPADAVPFPQAFEYAREAFVATHADGVIVAWNPAAERLYGYPADEAVGRRLDILDFPGEEVGLPPSGPGTEERERIRRQRHRSGHELWVSLRLVPLELPGRAPGTLLCALDVSDRWRAEDVLDGSRAALAASRSELRRAAARLVAGEEGARRRIAGELHDDVGQRLAGLALQIAAVGRRLAEGDDRRSEIDAVGDGMAELAEDLRHLSHDLHPAALEHRGLAAALGDHCAEVERRHHLSVRLSLDAADVAFPPEVALGIYRVAQEALANAVRHAGARSVHVSLTSAAGTAQLAVADDGVGFDPAAARRTGGLGLVIISERARILGGRSLVASAPGAGTEVEVTVPLPKPAGAAGAEVPGSEPAKGDTSSRPRKIGRYRLLDEIGRGAKAIVYLAEEPPPLRRRVALKLHRGPLPGRRETLRFKAEQQALARLHHPAIAEVHEARTTEEGDLYIVMEYAPGMPITAYCDRYELDLDRRLELFAAVCDGVAHAHRKGILHRDLKPAKVLVTEAGGTASPKIVDFGVAKGFDRPLAEDTVWSAEELVGTPSYLAPEALGGGELDARSDVYALGVLLYELLMGAVPIAPDGGGIAGLAAWVEAVRRGEAPPPSRRLAAVAFADAAAAAEVARHRGVGDVSRLVRLLRGDLDRVVLKAIAPEPAVRYPTVDALRDEVRRALRGEPVEAGPPGTLHQLGRLARRHRRLAAATALVFLALAVGLVATAFQARRAEREAARADAAARFLEEVFAAADPRRAKGEPADARELLRRGAERLAGELADQPLLKARLLDTLGGIDTELGFYDQARPLLEEALALRERLLGGGDPAVAATLARLGRLARLSGRGDAEALLRRALAIREARLGPDHPEVADLLGDLGTALAAAGRLDEGEVLLRRALAIDERRRGANDPQTAKVLHNLSGIALYRGRPDEAEALLERALAIREAALPEDDLDLAGSREALALVRLDQGRPAEAAALLERQAATAERVYGPDHPALARALLNLGLARRDLGDDAAAQSLLERAVAITDRSLAPEHPQHLRALATLADFHFERGRYAEAEPLYRRLAALRESGAPVPAGADWPADWAALLRATGREAEAAAFEARAGSR